MIKAVVSRKKEDIKGYVKYMLLFRNKKTFPVLIIYFICLLLICATGITLAFMWDIFFSLAIICVAMCLLLVAVTIAFLAFTVKKYTNDLYASQSAEKITSVEISATGIIVSFEGVPDKLFDWSMVNSADFYKTTAFYILANGSLLIIYESNISYGSIKELQQITNEKLVKQND